MKKIIFIAILAFGMSAKAQITLEHIYDSAAANWATIGNVFNRGQIVMVDFELSGQHYVHVNGWGKSVSIYDLNHSLVKSISLANCPLYSQGTLWYLFYFSEQLFDLDTDIDFMYYNQNGIVHIYHEDGSLIFSDTASITDLVTNGGYLIMQHRPIFNTVQGTKMILNYDNTGQAKVYSLPGTLLTSIDEGNNALINEYSNNLKLSNPYPNPTTTSTKVDYTLPDGVSQGEIVFYTIQGAEVKRFKVDRTFNNLLISTADIKAGTYYYQLQTATENSGGKKMVVIK